MRTMQHNSRTNSKGKVHGTKHNDRNFDVTQADNIDPEKVHLNKYWNCYDDDSLTFDDVELRFYEENFGEQLQKTNDAYTRNGHPERCKSMEDWKKLKRNAPEETTFQIGRKYDEQGRIVDQFVDADTLMECFQDYNARLNKWNEEHGKPFTQLTYSLHADESVPHVQSRKVWHYTAEDGTIKIGQEKALAAAGVELPNPGKDPGRRNNRKMTFDKMCREMWLDVLHEHGLDIEREPVPDGRHNRDKEDMIREKYDAISRESAAAKDEVLHLQNELSELVAKYDGLAEEHNELLEANNRLEEKYNLLAREYNDLAIASEHAKNIDEIEAKKTFDGKVKLDPDDYAQLVEFAKSALLQTQLYQKAIEHIEKLGEELEELKKNLKLNPSQYRRAPALEAFFELIMSMIDEGYMTDREVNQIARRMEQNGIYLQMDWSLQQRIDDSLGTDFARRDKEAYYKKKAARTKSEVQKGIGD